MTQLSGSRLRKPLLPRHAWQTVMLWSIIAFLVVFLIYPILLTVRGAFADDVTTGSGFTLRHMLLVLEDPGTLAGLGNAFKVAVSTTLLCLVISLPLASHP